jgi:hypothetical protein
MASKWFIRVRGKTFGPFDSGELVAFARAGKIGPTTDIANSQGGPWVPASSLRELFAQPQHSLLAHRSTSQIRTPTPVPPPPPKPPPVHAEAGQIGGRAPMPLRSNLPPGKNIRQRSVPLSLARIVIGVVVGLSAVLCTTWVLSKRTYTEEIVQAEVRKPGAGGIPSRILNFPLGNFSWGFLDRGYSFDPGARLLLSGLDATYSVHCFGKFDSTNGFPVLPRSKCNLHLTCDCRLTPDGASELQSLMSDLSIDLNHVYVTDELVFDLLSRFEGRCLTITGQRLSDSAAESLAQFEGSRLVINIYQLSRRAENALRRNPLIRLN